MKKRTIIIAIAGLLLMQLHSCTKNELVTVNDPLEMDEDSPLFQGYLAERAINFIKTYRFDKLDGLIDRITDPAMHEKVMACYREYRALAADKALFFVTPENDTLFFLPSIAKEEPFFNVDFEPGFFFLHTQRNMLNSTGVLQGFKNYPNVENFRLMNCRAYEVKDLEAMPLMKWFTWEWLGDYMEEKYPDETFIPVQLVADLSRNPKLMSVALSHVDVTHIVFPVYKLDEFVLHDGMINRNDNLDDLSATNVLLEGTAARGDLVLKSTGIDSLKLYVPVDHLDVSRTAMQKLIVNDVKNLTLNEGLRKLEVRAIHLNEQPELPVSLEELKLEYYSLTGLDLSAHPRLKRASLSPNREPLRMEEWTFPAEIEQIDLRWAFTGLMDFSGLSSLTDLKIEMISNDTYTEWPVRFPTGLKRLNCSGQLPGTMDLSDVTGLERLYISDYPWNLQKIILPPNLTETQVQGMKWGQPIMFISTNTVLENAPEWLEKYVTYY